MKLNNLIAKPQLVKMTLDDADIVKKYGEPIEWFVWDRQPLQTFFKFASENGGNVENIFLVLKEMILDENGKPLLTGEETLPTDVLIRVMNKMSEVLGK
ncbi:MAG: hypothetical protein RJA42_294 [Bacteroidota bacterium]|jgi:hypothetical protein